MSVTSEIILNLEKAQEIYKDSNGSGCICLTKNAIREMSNRIALQSHCFGYQIKVVGKGCAGNKYELDYLFSDKNIQDAIRFDFNGLKFYLFIDPLSLLKVFGTVIDYVENDFVAEFTFHNPSASQVCSCGQSFS